ncbi:MAG TPA: RES family NAD+ phosphorylase [Candidatus Dormibacteraeota bacterium]|nr:RES family NAD+ phosphorylase [Candidatus Dormibacteraeota bacterium]
MLKSFAYSADVQRLGTLANVADEDLRPATDPQMLEAFIHPSRYPSRFSDGTYGIYYAARALETAVHEVVFHRARFYAATGEPPLRVPLRDHVADVNGELHDLLTNPEDWAAVYDPDPERYRAAQQLGRELKLAGSYGIAYRSVRHRGGECVAVFRPPVLSRYRLAQHIALEWNGREIIGYSPFSALT